MNVDPELRKRVEQIKSSPVQLYREAGDYSNRELVEGILVSPDDIAAIEAVARAELREAARAYLDAEAEPAYSWLTESQAARHENRPNREIERIDHVARKRAALNRLVGMDPAEAAHHRMVQPDHYQRWER